MRKIKIDGYTFNVPDQTSEFDTAKSIGSELGKMGFLMPGDLKPVPPEPRPEPRYKSGTRFQRNKYAETEMEFSANHMVWCTVTRPEWYDHKRKVWIYGATADEPVRMYDDWTPLLTTDCCVDDEELDRQYKNKQDAETTNS